MADGNLWNPTLENPGVTLAEETRVSRSPDEVQAEIERTRHQLANTLDQLAQRTSPKRLADDTKSKIVETLNTPAGKAVVGAVGGVVVLLVVLRVRRRFTD